MKRKGKFTYFIRYDSAIEKPITLHEMLHCYFLIEYPVKQLEQLSTQQSMPTQDEKKTEQKESMEEGMESEDEEEAIEEGYEEYDPAYEVDGDSIIEEDDEEFIEEASE